MAEQPGNAPRGPGPDGAAAGGQQIVRRATNVAPATNDNWLVSMLSEGRVALRRKQARIDDFLPDVEAITERRHSPFATLLVFVLFGMVVATVIWMAVSKIDQVASAPAVVRPTGKAKVINHPEGGRIVQVLVAEGQEVRKGDLLVRLDSDLVEQEIAKVGAQYYTLAAEVARLEAETSGQPLVFPPELADQPKVRADQESLYRARRDELMSRRAAADAAASQLESRAAGLRERVNGIEESVKYLRQQEAALKKVTDMKYFPEIRYLSVMRDLSEQNGLLGQQRRELIASQRAHEESVQRRAIIDNEWMSANQKQLAASKADRDRFKAALEQQLALRTKMEIRAPESGTVKDLKILSPGQAVRFNEPILGIVPADEAGIEIEARVSNNERGSIWLGQAATLKFTAYDWIRYGVLQGRVVHIDRDATQPANDEFGQTRANQQPYFRVIIKFDYDPDTGTPLTYVTRGTDIYRITAGMTAVAELHIGERTIMEFFTDRIFSVVLGSFREK
jgi:adhesin transport system membrane fusion protein